MHYWFRNIVLALIVFAVVWAAFFYWANLRGAWPALLPPPDDIADLLPDDSGASDELLGAPRSGGGNMTAVPLSLPDGVSISVLADNIPSARVMVIDGLGNMWVSQRGEGTVTLLEINDGRVVAQTPVFRGLRNPHGLAIHPNDPFLLYIAEEDTISRVRLYSDAPRETIVDLPRGGGGHVTRTLGFGPDNRLYVSIGSTCNVCYEKDSRHAAIYSMNDDGSDMRLHASGLRNAVFFTWSYVDGRMWATEMGRDRLGDDLPPDEINIIEEGGNYGWPECYGKNVLDADFHDDDHQHIRAHCIDPLEIPSYIDLQAHSAPLGLAFVPEEGWPEQYWYDLIVAHHGSWNRTEPTGYKLVRVRLDENGVFGGVEDFITGWLTADGRSLGRPVDVLTMPGGLLYVSDDKAGVIYKIIVQ